MLELVSLYREVETFVKMLAKFSQRNCENNKINNFK